MDYNYFVSIIKDELLWWERLLEGLGFEELDKFKFFLEELKNNEAIRVGEL